jgi:hypothetical protein
MTRSGHISNCRPPKERINQIKTSEGGEGNPKQLSTEALFLPLLTPATKLGRSTFFYFSARGERRRTKLAFYCVVLRPGPDQQQHALLLGPACQ